MLDTLVIGSGFSGIGMGVALRRAGRHDFEIWERADALGGTWRDNHYPGCACDIAAPVYSYSFAPKPDWTSLFAKQPEILAYLQGVARRFGIEEHLRLRREMTDARWTGTHWQVSAADGTVAEARFLVLGTGALSNGKLPAIPGLDSFTGALWHSADWNHGFDLAGKRVAVIGTGASAIQIVPEIAPQVAHLSVFQRTPPWVMPKHDRAIGRAEAERCRRRPWRQKLLRLGLFSLNEVAVPNFKRMWGLARIERMARRHMEAAIADPILRERLTPSFRFGCKRVLISNDWYPTLARNTVELVTSRIEAVTSAGIRTADGRERPFDAIIFATGFDVEGALRGHDIRGRGGVKLRDVWAEEPKALGGISVAGFPNMFILLGPSTGLGHNSVVYMIEAQIAHVMSAMRLAQERHAPIVAREAAQQAWFDAVQAGLQGSVWQNGGCESWYLDRKGVNYTLWPGHSFNYRRMVKRANPGDYATVEDG